MTELNSQTSSPSPSDITVVLVSVWAARLGSFLFRRMLRAGKDDRFDALKPSALRFLAVWTVQGLWVSLTLAAALAAVTTSAREPLGLLALLGLATWIVGFGVEAVADWQKSRFRADAANRGRYVDSGLWAWSRHPNYFGEIVLWIGMALIAVPVLSGWQWFTLISPLFVALLLTRISGVPMLERCILHLKSYGISKVIINVHHFADDVIAFLKKKLFFF